MENSAAVASSHNIYQVIGSTSMRKPRVSQVTEESDGSLIHFQDPQMERWAEPFREQFIWSRATYAYKRAEERGILVLH